MSEPSEIPDLPEAPPDADLHDAASVSNQALRESARVLKACDDRRLRQLAGWLDELHLRRTGHSTGTDR